jgi:uncharacterized protein YdbL (DUF1318 family)
MALVVAGLTVTCARITVNVYFPAAEIRDAATQIEREVRSKEEGPADANPAPAPKPQSSDFSRFWWVRLRLGPANVMAQGIDINMTTPAIRQLVASRKQRYASLVPLFNAGALGESNQGLVVIRSLDALALKDKAQAKILSEQENRDRQQLYRELATANQLPPDKVADIARIFAQVNRQEAQAGWWIQEPNGDWKKK